MIDEDFNAAQIQTQRKAVLSKYPTPRQFLVNWLRLDEDAVDALINEIQENKEHGIFYKIRQIILTPPEESGERPYYSNEGREEPIVITSEEEIDRLISDLEDNPCLFAPRLYSDESGYPTGKDYEVASKRIINTLKSHKEEGLSCAALKDLNPSIIIVEDDFESYSGMHFLPTMLTESFSNLAKVDPQGPLVMSMLHEWYHSFQPRLHTFGNQDDIQFEIQADRFAIYAGRKLGVPEAVIERWINMRLFNETYTTEAYIGIGTSLRRLRGNINSLSAVPIDDFDCQIVAATRAFVNSDDDFDPELQNVIKGLMRVARKNLNFDPDPS